MDEIIDMLHANDCSCVVSKEDDIRLFRQRGVADLYNLVCNSPDFMEGAAVADKVVGKAAAALMIKGKIKCLHSDIISQPALSLLKEFNIPVSFGKTVPYIINRNKTGRCPLETLCYDKTSIDEMFGTIQDFVEKQTNR